MQPLAPGYTALQSLTIAIALVRMQRRAGVLARLKVTPTRSLCTCGRQNACTRAGATCEAGIGSRCPRCMTPVPAADVTHRRLGDALCVRPNLERPTEATSCISKWVEASNTRICVIITATRRHPDSPSPCALHRLHASKSAPPAMHEWQQAPQAPSCHLLRCASAAGMPG